MALVDGSHAHYCVVLGRHVWFTNPCAQFSTRDETRQALSKGD